MISFLMSPMARYLALALVVVTAVGGSYVKGRSDGESLAEAKVAAERAAWTAKVAEQQASAAESTETIIKDYITIVNHLQTEVQKLRNTKPTSTSSTKYITEYITVYVPKEVDKPVNNGFVDLHNTAAEGKILSDIAKADNAQYSKFTLSDVGRVVADNYYMCNITAARLVALQNVVLDFQSRQSELVSK